MSAQDQRVSAWLATAPAAVPEGWLRQNHGYWQDDPYTWRCSYCSRCVRRRDWRWRSRHQKWTAMSTPDVLRAVQYRVWVDRNGGCWGIRCQACGGDVEVHRRRTRHRRWHRYNP